MCEETSPETCQPHVNKKRKGFAQRVKDFFDEEADICSNEGNNDDMDETAELEAIEDQELLESSFINDSSQLGFSPDELDQVCPDDGACKAIMNRTVANRSSRLQPLPPLPLGSCRAVRCLPLYRPADGGR